MKTKAMTFGLLLSLIAVGLLSTPSSVHAVYGYNYEKDGWGNKVEIWISFSTYGGTVKVKATAYWIGFTFFGVKIGTPIFYGERVSIIIYGYEGDDLRFGQWKGDTRGWQFDKSWSFSLPAGLTAVTVYATAYFDSIPFGHSTVRCTCYA